MTRFHIAAYLNEAVDKTRRSENRQLIKEQDKTLSKSKYVCLKSDENLTDKQRETLESLQGLELETARVWAFQESFRHFFSCTVLVEAKAFFEKWHEAAISVGNEHLSKSGSYAQRPQRGFVRLHSPQSYNAAAESLNAQIQHIKACAKGYRRFSNFRIAILFFLGN